MMQHQHPPRRGSIAQPHRRSPASPPPPSHPPMMHQPQPSLPADVILPNHHLPHHPRIATSLVDPTSPSHRPASTCQPHRFPSRRLLMTVAAIVTLSTSPATASPPSSLQRMQISKQRGADYSPLRDLLVGHSYHVSGRFALPNRHRESPPRRSSPDLSSAHPLSSSSSTTSSPPEPTVALSSVTVTTGLIAAPTIVLPTISVASTQNPTATVIPIVTSSLTTATTASSTPPNVEESGPSTVDLVNNQDIAYYANITIGNPPKEFIVNVDTGSSLMWVGSSSCTQCKDLHHYNAAFSSSSILTDEEKSIRYGSGNVTGVRAFDTVSFGGIVSTNQTFLSVTSEDYYVMAANNGSFDGILGLSYQNGLDDLSNGALHDTIIYSLWKQGHIENPVFSIWLNGSADGNSYYTNGGELVLGGVDPGHHKSDIKYLPVSSIPGLTDTYYWAVQSDGVSVGNDVAKPATPLYTIFDTGTTLIALDTNTFKTSFVPMLQKYAPSLGPITYKGRDGQIHETGVYQVKCYDAPLMPNLTFHLAGSDFSIDWRGYVLSDKTNCFLGVQGLPSLAGITDATTWILGDVFLRQFLTVYDLRGQVGLAVVANTTGTLAPNPSALVRPQNATTTSTSSSGSTARALVAHALLIASALSLALL